MGFSMDAKDGLQKLFWEFHDQHPGMELRDIASHLEVSEAVLLSSFLGAGAWEISAKPSEILTLLLQQPHAFTCHTRVPFAQMETRLTPKANLQVVGANEITLSQDNARFHFATENWAYVYFLEEESHAGWIRSLQFFDCNGCATLKIFLNDGDASFHQEIKKRFCNTRAVFISDLKPIPNGRGFQFDKHAMTAVTPFTCSGILSRILEQQLTLHAFIRNPGFHHEHVGLLSQVFKRGPWIYALGPDLEIRIQFKQFGAAYILKNKQRLDLEYYDKTGEFMVGFFMDNPHETKIWEDLLNQIPR